MSGSRSRARQRENGRRAACADVRGVIRRGARPLRHWRASCRAPRGQQFRLAFSCRARERDGGGAASSEAPLIVPFRNVIDESAPRPYGAAAFAPLLTNRQRPKSSLVRVRTEETVGRSTAVLACVALSTHEFKVGNPAREKSKRYSAAATPVHPCAATSWTTTGRCPNLPPTSLCLWKEIQGETTLGSAMAY